MRRHLTADELRHVTTGLYEPWRDHAACQGRAHVMDPPRGDRATQAIWDAKQICAGCPVLTDCACWVLGLPANGDPGGQIVLHITELEATDGDR
ncbi:MAG: WhiB family transcriptional regulator [Microbispora sp.]|nr:WhiB family transcriptional regulator [Microbispora sp.]